MKYAITLILKARSADLKLEDNLSYFTKMTSNEIIKLDLFYWCTLT